MAMSCKCRDIGMITSANKCRCCMCKVSYIDRIILDGLRVWKDVESDGGRKVRPLLISFFGISLSPALDPFVG